MFLAGLMGGGAGGGGGASTSQSTGPQKSGDIGASSFSFGGINTGTQSALPPYAIPVALAFAGILIGIYIWRK